MFNNFMMMSGVRGPAFVGSSPAFVGSSLNSNVSGTANSKSVTVFPHANTKVGDLLIMAVSRSGTGNVVPGQISGWTRLTGSDLGGSFASLALYYRYRQSGDTFYTTASVSTSYSVIATLLSFRGAAVGNNATTTNLASGTVTIPELSSISSGATLVSFFALGTFTTTPPSVTSTPPGSEVVINQGFPQAYSQRLWIGMEPNQPPGPTGDRVLGVSGATRARAVLLEIQ